MTSSVMDNGDNTVTIYKNFTYNTIANPLVQRFVYFIYAQAGFWLIGQFYHLKNKTKTVEPERTEEVKEELSPF